MICQKSWLVYAEWDSGTILSDCSPHDSTYTVYLLNSCAQQRLSQCGVLNVYQINTVSKPTSFVSVRSQLKAGIMPYLFCISYHISDDFKLKSNTQTDWLNLVWR